MKWFAKEVADEVVFMDEGMIVEKSRPKSSLIILNLKELNFFKPDIIIFIMKRFFLLILSINYYKVFCTRWSL